MKVLLFTDFYLPGFRGGGPIKTIANLVHATANDIGYFLVTSDHDLGDSSPYSTIQPNVWIENGLTAVLYCSTSLGGTIKVIVEVLSNKYDIVYLNSFFSPFFSILPLVLSRLFKKTVILGPRGEFSQGALLLKKKKKAIYLKLFKFLNLQNSLIFQASSAFEAADIRRVLGRHVDVFIAEDISAFEIPNWIPGKDARRLKLVFISRISPKKNLLQALRIVAKVSLPILYEIYGPIEDDEYWGQCQSIISSLPKHVVVQYRGELKPIDVVQTLSQYDLFFFPTKGENYGHVIAEAICAGLPILISDATPWRGLQEKGIGWDISLNQESLFINVIETVAEMSAAEFRQFRESVLGWAREKFLQSESIEANKAMFRYAFEKKQLYG